MPGEPGHYKLSNARPPGLIVKKMPGVCPGGGARGWNCLAHKFAWKRIISTVHSNFYQFSEAIKDLQCFVYEKCSSHQVD